MRFFAVVLLLAVLAQAWRSAERGAYQRGRRRGFQEELREAARLSCEVEDLAARRAPRRIGGWYDFPRPPH